MCEDPESSTLQADTSPQADKKSKFTMNNCITETSTIYSCTSNRVGAAVGIYKDKRPGQTRPPHYQKQRIPTGDLAVLTNLDVFQRGARGSSGRSSGILWRVPMSIINVLDDPPHLRILQDSPDRTLEKSARRPFAPISVVN